MAQKSQAPKSNLPILLSGSGLAIVVLVGLLVWGWLQYSQYRAGIAQASPNFSSLNVNIVSPQTGLETNLGETVFVAAQVSSPKPLKALELWANGSMVSTQAATADQAKLSSLFKWTPAQMGTYLITVRAINTSGDSADSLTRAIIVQSNNKAAAPTTVSPLAAGQLPLGSPLFSPPAPDQTTPAQPWSDAVGGWLGQLGQTTLPKAPELAAQVDGCTTQLTIHDLSNNEAGFYVDRQSTALPQWQRLTTLNGQTQSAYLTYTDSNSEGMMLYRVVAFNTQGETASNLVTIQTDPVKCPPKLLDQPVMVGTIEQLSSTKPAEQAYCYKSLDGVNWERFPKVGFLPAEKQGFKLSDPTLFALVMPKGTSSNKPMSLTLDCWGWTNGAVESLGKVQLDNFGVDKLGAFNLAGGALSAKLLVNLKPKFQVLDAEGTMQFPLSSFLPTPKAFGSVSALDCEAHIPTSQIGYCESPEAVSSNGYPFKPSFLVWDLPPANTGCAAQVNCINPKNPDLQKFPELAGGKFGYNIYSFGQEHTPIQSIADLARTVYIPPPVSLANCGQKINLIITTYFIPKDSQQMVESSPAVVSVPGECPTRSFVYLYVSINDITLNNVHEEANEGNTLALYGTMFAMPQWVPWPFLKLAEYGAAIPSTCPSQGAAFDEMTIYGGHCPLKVTPGFAYPLSSTPLCRANSFQSCTGAFTNGNNKLIFPLMEGEPFNLWITLVDRDLNSSDDAVCEANIIFSRSTADFVKTSGEVMPFATNNAVASCSGTITITVVDSYLLPK